MTLRVLHLEDNHDDAYLIEQILKRRGISAQFTRASGREGFTQALAGGEVDLILCDGSVPGFAGFEALRTAREMLPRVPFYFLSGVPDDRLAKPNLKDGADRVFKKGDFNDLIEALQHVQESAPETADTKRLEQENAGMRRLVKAVQDLSLARSVDEVAKIVRSAARDLTGSDGATFVLRDGEKCYYADEDAIEPLWKGQRFPMSACVSGWVMLNKQPAVIPDIYNDPRVPADAYRPTFVKSLAMVPIRMDAPIGAIGNYWAKPYEVGAVELELLQALANTTSVALENVAVYAELDQRVKDRTVQLEAANKDLESFSYSVSHDLQAPLRTISGFSGLLTEALGTDLEDDAKSYLNRIQSETKRMGELIEDLLRLARISRGEVKSQSVDLSAMAERILGEFQRTHSGRSVKISVQPGLHINGDKGLMAAALENLLSNAWKYSGKRENAEIEFGATNASGEQAFFVRDNGAGFDMKHAERLFAPFQRLHRQEDFPGSGVGLATVRRIIARHGGKIWAEASPDHGATFYFTVPQRDDRLSVITQSPIT